MKAGRKSAPPPLNAVDEAAGRALNAAILTRMGADLGGHEPKGCRWVLGSVRGKDWKFCQQGLAPDGAYCPEHRARTVKAG